MSKKKTKNEAATILSESLDRIAEAILLLATEVKRRPNTIAVIGTTAGDESMVTPEKEIQRAHSRAGATKTTAHRN